MVGGKPNRDAGKERKGVEPAEIGERPKGQNDAERLWWYASVPIDGCASFTTMALWAA